MFLKLCQYVKDLLNIGLVPDQVVTQKMCKDNPWMLQHVLDQFVTQEMCNEAVQSYPWALENVPDQFITRKNVQ